MHKTCEDAMKVLRGLSKGKKVAGIPEQVPRSIEHTRNNAAVLQKTKTALPRGVVGVELRGHIY